MNNRADLKKTSVIFAVFAVISIMTASEQFVPSGHAVDVMDVIRSSHHAIIIESPKNGSIYKDKEQMPLNFTVEYVYQEEYIAWQILNKLFYSFDGGPAKTIKVISEPTPIPYRFSTLLDMSDLSNGLHKIEVTASFAVNINNLFVLTYNFSSTPISFSVFRDQAPNISILFPENKTYDKTNIPSNFTVNETTSWMGYSLDGQDNVTITGNTTLTGLPDGPHNLVVYAKDNAGNTGASETIYFSIVSPPPDLNGEIFLITNWIFWGMIIIAVVGVALLVYFRKIRKTTGKTEIISEGVT